MKTRLFTFAALALALAACTNDDENLNNGSVAAVINAEISDAVSTRASGTQWTTNDEIGISESRFGYANVLYRGKTGSSHRQEPLSSSKMMTRPPSPPTIPTMRTAER